MKWAETLIIDNHKLCNLRCAHCQGPNADRMKMLWMGPDKDRIPARISLAELTEVVKYLKETGMIGGGNRIADIRFGGDWCEPTLDPELPEKVDYLLQTTEGNDCRIWVITNGVTAPSGDYSPDLMREYFVSIFGFEAFPERFRMNVSADDEHLNSYIRLRLLQSRIASDQAQSEYLEKIANLICYARVYGNVDRLLFNAVESTVAPPNFTAMVRDKFGIPEDFALGVLRRSIYTPQQIGLKDAISLVGTSEPPLNSERCYFLTKRNGRVVFFPDIASFGFNIHSFPFREFIFPDPTALEILA